MSKALGDRIASELARWVNLKNKPERRGDGVSDPFGIEAGKIMDIVCDGLTDHIAQVIWYADTAIPWEKASEIGQRDPLRVATYIVESLYSGVNPTTWTQEKDR